MLLEKMFSEISADIYIMIDGDDTYDVENINEMIALLQRDSLDMVVAKEFQMIPVLTDLGIKQEIEYLQI